MTADNLTALLPCPFCGCDVDNEPPTPFPLDAERQWWAARCGNPGCAAEIVNRVPERVAEKWNARALLAARDADAPESWRSFIPGRYPYTYAYDLLRARWPHYDERAQSRSATSEHVTKMCADLGLDKEAICKRLANIAIAYEMAVERAAAEREAAIYAIIPSAALQADAARGEGQS